MGRYTNIDMPMLELFTHKGDKFSSEKHEEERNVNAGASYFRGMSIIIHSNEQLGVISVDVAEVFFIRKKW